MKTAPLKAGAPLPDDEPIIAPTLLDVRAEITRAQVELMYAIAMHRKAWSRMRAIRQDRDARADQKGIPVYLDNDPNWKVATGDVAWWRGEMQAQAAAISALQVIRTWTDDPPRPGSVREIVMGWDGTSRPTLRQVSAARSWLTVSGGKGHPEHMSRCRELITRFESKVD